MKTLKNVITGDETWVYGYDVETKCSRCSGWEYCCHDKKKTCQSRSKCEGDVDSFFFGGGGKGIVHYEFVPCGATVNKEFYLNVLKRLREAV